MRKYDDFGVELFAVGHFQEGLPDMSYFYFYQGYYKRTDQYLPILKREEKGCHEVVMLHSCTLIDLRRTASTKLFYNPEGTDYNGPIDDVMVFAYAVAQAGRIEKKVVLNSHAFKSVHLKGSAIHTRKELS